MTLVTAHAAADVVLISRTGGSNVYAPYSGADECTICAPGGQLDAPMVLLTGWSNYHRGWMEFDLAAVPAGSIITGVQLAFEQGSLNREPIDIAVRGGFQPADAAYNTLFNYAGPTMTLPSRSVFTSMRADGAEFGTLRLWSSGAGSTQYLDLAGGLSFFDSNIGSEVMLTSHLVDEIAETFHWGWASPSLQVEYITRGDLDCSGDVDFDDINAFVLAISDPAAYAAAYPDCDILLADCNGDGYVDFDDINAFVALLSGQ